jgi:predicted kinase
MTALPIVFILKGLPASGKTTYARAMEGCRRVNKDDLRAMFDNGRYSPENERLIAGVRDLAILAGLAWGNVVVDDTNLDPKHEAQIREVVGPLATVQVIRLDCDVEECIRRDAARPHPVGEDVIREMDRKWGGG